MAGGCCTDAKITSAELAQNFKKDGILSYVKLVQNKEREIGCDVLTHQKWYVHSVAIAKDEN
jgi:isocitrate lyase